MFNLMSAAAAKPNRIKFSSCFFFLPWLEVLLDCSINHCSINHCPVVKYQAGLGLSDAALERSNLILAKTAPGKGDSTETYCISSQPSTVFFCTVPRASLYWCQGTMSVARYSLAQYLGISAFLAVIRLVSPVPALFWCR